MLIESLTSGHWPSVAAIYAEGIATGNATFETEVPSWEVWNAKHLVALRFVATDGAVLGFAALSRVSPRDCYRGVCEVSVYVGESARGKGVGLRLLHELVNASEREGIWTLQASIFPENRASLTIHERCGFRVVGRRERIARLNDMWRDTLLLERRAAGI